MSGSRFTCPRCGATSHNPNDATNGYCGRCHTFVGGALAQLYYAWEELDALAGLVEHRLAVSDYRDPQWSMFNSLRTSLREAQSGLEPMRARLAAESNDRVLSLPPINEEALATALDELTTAAVEGSIEALAAKARRPPPAKRESTMNDLRDL